MSAARKYFRPADIAKMTGLSIRTIRRRIADGTLPSSKFVGARLVASEDTDRLLSPLTDLPKDQDDDSE